MCLKRTKFPGFCVYFDIDSKREVCLASIRMSIADVSGASIALSHGALVLWPIEKRKLFPLTCTTLALI